MTNKIQKLKPGTIALMVLMAVVLVLGGLMMSHDFRWSVCQISKHRVCIRVAGGGVGSTIAQDILKGRKKHDD